MIIIMQMEEMIMMQREEMIMIIISLTALSPLDSLAQGAVFFGCLYSPKIL